MLKFSIWEAPSRHGLVPLSYLGAGGTSIPALSNRQHQVVAIVARLHTGSDVTRGDPEILFAHPQALEQASKVPTTS